MASIAQTLNAFEAAETFEARQHGSRLEVAKAELLALDRFKKAIEARIKAYREIAIEEGMAHYKAVWTEEHVVKGHFKNRFTWTD